MTFSRLLEFFNAATAYTKDNDERSTVTYALTKLISFYRKKIEKIQRDWQDEVNDAVEEIRVKYCEKDKDTGLFKERTYGEGATLVIKKVFLPENEKKANKEIRAKSKEIEDSYMNLEVELKTHFVGIPSNMDITWIEAFSGFIFEPISEEEMEAHYLAQSKVKNGDGQYDTKDIDELISRCEAARKSLNTRDVHDSLTDLNNIADRMKELLNK